MKILIATNNHGKFREISKILCDSEITLLSLSDLSLEKEKVEEDGKTFAENARKKALYFAQKSKLLTLAEDSGIIVDALSGELGIKTRRWGAGEKVTDEEWITYFLQRLENVPVEKRTAKFVCFACLVDGTGKILQEVDWESHGKITQELQAPIIPGLPISSCFIPEKADKVFAAMSSAEKAQFSHRGGAMKLMKTYLLEKFCSKPF